MATTKEELLVLGIKANGHYLGQVEASCLYIRQVEASCLYIRQVEASCLYIRQVAVIYCYGTSVVKNLKFLTPFSGFLIIKLYQLSL